VTYIHIFKDTESNDQNEEEQKPTFLKNIDKFKDSRPVKMAKGISSIAGEHLGKFSKNFESTLKAESEKQVNGKNQE